MLICCLRSFVVTTSDVKGVPDSCRASLYLREEAHELELEVNFWISTDGGSSNSGGNPNSRVELMAEVGTLRK